MFAVHTLTPKHWFLVHVNFQENAVLFLDSIKKDHSKWFNRLMEFFEYFMITCHPVQLQQSAVTVQGRTTSQGYFQGPEIQQ